MKKSIITIFTLWLTLNFSAFAATSALSNTSMSKAELCDVAIKTLEQMLNQSGNTAATPPVITKEQCMAIPDEEINNAVKGMMDKSPK